MTAITFPANTAPELAANLIDTLNSSHQQLRKIADSMMATADIAVQNQRFEQLWQQFFAHEVAEERVAFSIVQQQAISNGQFTNKALKFAVDEHHYFESFVEHIALLPYHDPKRQQMLAELVAQLDSHLRYEEAYIFPRLAESLNPDQHQQLINDYLGALSHKPLPLSA